MCVIVHVCVSTCVCLCVCVGVSNTWKGVFGSDNTTGAVDGVQRWRFVGAAHTQGHVQLPLQEGGGHTAWLWWGLGWGLSDWQVEGT